MKTSAYVLVTSFLLLPHSSWGQDHFTLQQALDKALISNPPLQAANKELKIAEGRLLQAKAIPNPEIAGRIGEIPLSGSGDTSKELGVEQRLETGGKRGLRTRSAQADFEAAKFQYHVLTQDIIRQVKEIYWEMSLAHEEVNFAEQNVRTQQRFLARAQDRFQSGQAKVSDIARSKLEVARASNDLLVAQKKFAVGEANLNRLMGLDVRQRLSEPEHLKEVALPLVEDELIRQALENRSERKSIGAFRQGAMAELSLANRLLWAPDLRAGLVYQNNVRTDGRNSWGGSVGLALPLWYSYRGERLAAKGRLESLEAQTLQWEQAITSQVHQAYLEIQLAGEQVKLWKQAVDQATEATRYAEQQYLEGDADLLIFIQTRRELVNATLQYLETLKNYQVSLAALEWALGRELSGGNVL